MIKNKSGMIRIIEAFSMVLLITGVILIILNQGSLQKETSSAGIYRIEQDILRGIQLNDTLREDIVSLNGLPVEWNGFPDSIKNEVTNKTPSNLNCEGKVCEINDDCFFSKNVNASVYTQRVLISSSLDEYSPRKVKIFCWRK